MTIVYWITGSLVVGCVIGLLVGRKNPKVSDIAQAAADKLKS
jgi:hypothetical protein